MDDNTKKPWESLTLWSSLIMATAPMIPPVGALVSAYPGLSGTIAGLIVAGLRLISSKKISLS